MKKIFVVTLFTLFTTSSFAQISNINIKKGNVEQQDNSTAFFDLAPIGTSGNNTFFALYPTSMFMANVIGGMKNIQIGRLDKDLKMEQKEIELEYEGKEMDFEKVFLLKDQLIIFSSFQNKNQKKTYLFSQTIDKSSLSLKNDMKMIAEVDFSGENNYKNSQFSFAFSPDSSKVLISYNLLDKDNSLLSFGMNIYDSKLKKQYNIFNPSFASDGIYSFQKYLVDNAGNAFLLAEYYEDKKELKNSATFKRKIPVFGSKELIVEPNYTYKLVQFKSNEKATREYDLIVKDKFITNLDAKPDARGNIVCAGFTSPKEVTSVTGTCFLKIEPKSGKVIASSNKDFEIKFILEGMAKKDLKKFDKHYGTDKNFENFYYQIQNIHFKEDGGYYLFGEKTKKELVSNQQVTAVVYDHRDVVVVNYASNGDVIWVKKISKLQEDLADLGYMYLGYAHTVVGDDIYVAYTNMNKKNSNFVGTLKNTEAVLVKLDKQGNLTSTPIFNSDNDEITLRANDTAVKPNGDLIIYGRKNMRKHGFVEVDIK